MKNAFITLAIALIASLPAQAQDAQPNNLGKRAGVAVQLDISGGGDDLHNGEIHISHTHLGQGATLSLGGYWRASESSPFELQAFGGYKSGWGVFGDDADVKRWVFEVTGNYRTPDKWYVGGGPVYHLNPRYFDDFSGAVDVDFDNALGVALQGGWSWIGLQYTYMKYDSIYGRRDASSFGLRFTWRFEKPTRRRAN